MSFMLQAVMILLCLAGHAFFAGMETGVISIHRLRLRHLVRHRVRGADILQDFLDHPDRLLGTTLVGTNLFMVIASVTATSLATRLLGATGPLASGVLITLVALIACEYLPKAWFRGDPSYRAMPFASLLRVTGFIFSPLGRLVVGITKLIFPAPSKPESITEPFVTREELKHLTHESEVAGAISADERRMIHGVFELRLRACGEIMVPRGRMIIAHEDTPAEELIDVARRRGISRLPVFDDEAAQFVGIVHILDVVCDDQSEGKTAVDFARPPQFTSADTRVDDLLPRLRMTRQPMTLVTDAQSNVIGLLTSEDILEEIVGSLSHPPFDQKKA